MEPAASSSDGARILRRELRCVLKSWLWILALAFVIGSVPVFAADRNQDRGEHSRDGREAIDSGDRSSPNSISGSENNQREREWREYQKARNKSYKEWTKANREEQKDFEKYLREREKDMREMGARQTGSIEIRLANVREIVGKTSANARSNGGSI